MTPAKPALPKSPPSTPAHVEEVRAKVEAEAAEALITSGQRRVNLLWETTQTAIALPTMWVVLAVAAYLALQGDSTAIVLLGNMQGLVVGFYFSRVNHQKVGGVGKDDAGR